MLLLYGFLLMGLTSLFKAAPASAVTMWTYERVLRTLLDWKVLE